MLHGVIPGPLIMKNHPQMFWGVITSMYIGNVILLILNIPLIRLFVKIIETPYSVLSPLIIVICAIGAFSINNNPLDVLAMMIFGGLGYVMRKFDYDPAPLLLAYILGPILEKSINQSLVADVDKRALPVITLSRNQTESRTVFHNTWLLLTFIISAVNISTCLKIWLRGMG